MSHFNKGRKHTAETRRKVSEGHKGQIPWNKGKHGVQIVWNKGLKGYSTKRKGFVMSEEQKIKISESKKGTPAWNKGLKTFPHSLEWKKKVSAKLRGDKNHLWKGGITPVNEKIRRSIEYKEWRKSVFERDNYTCTDCGARNGNGITVVLQADHIKPFAHFPESRFEITNGRTLCITCHRLTDTYGRGAEKYATTR